MLVTALLLASIAAPPAHCYEPVAPAADGNPFGDDGDAKNPGDWAPRDPEPWFSSFLFFTDQDVFLTPAYDMDRNYTMGMGFQSSGRWVAEAGLALPLKGINYLLGLDCVMEMKVLGSDPHGPGETHTVMLAGSAFTPLRLYSEQPQLDDRPYGSIVSLSVARSVMNPEGSLGLRTELTVGVLGLPVAEALQSGIHKIGNWVTPRGWPNQISDGGEPTLRYAVEARYRTAALLPWFDLSLDAQSSIGYYTNAAAGLTFRLGKLGSSFFSLQTNPLAMVNAAADAPEAERPTWELYVYGSGRSRLVLYNALLQGQFRNNPHELDWSQLQPFVIEFEGGFRARYRRALFGFSLAGRTAETTLPERRTHYWGSLVAGYTN